MVALYYDKLPNGKYKRKSRSELPQDIVEREREKQKERYAERSSNPEWRELRNTYNRERYKRCREETLERTREYQKQRKKDDPRYAMTNAARSRAKRSGLEFNITMYDFEIPDTCPILRIPIVVNTDKKTASPNSPSLDRVDNTKGYVRGNIAVISHRANTIKSNLSEEDIMRLLNYVRSYK